MMHDPAPVARPGRVLVVEDDVALRFVVSEVLRDGGLTVIEAASGDEALDYLRGDPHVDLVFTDVHMPGATDGLALAARIHETWPDIQVLLTSGRHHPDHPVPFIAKPYVFASVLATVQTMLEGSDGE